jgi:integrase
MKSRGIIDHSRPCSTQSYEFLNPRSEVRILSAPPIEHIEQRLQVRQGSDHAFPNEIVGAQQHSVPEHRFKKLVARAGPPPIRIHDLRHTAGSLMLAQGVPALEVSRILGHASVDIT